MNKFWSWFWQVILTGIPIIIWAFAYIANTGNVNASFSFGSVLALCAKIIQQHTGKLQNAGITLLILSAVLSYHVVVFNVTLSNT